MTTSKQAGLIPATLNKRNGIMKYLVLSDTVADKKRVAAGDIIELDADEGRILVSYGKVEEYKGKEKKETNRSVCLEKSENKPLKKRTKK